MPLEKVLVGKTLDELKELVGQWGEPTYRAEQLAEWAVQAGSYHQRR